MNLTAVSSSLSSAHLAVILFVSRPTRLLSLPKVHKASQLCFDIDPSIALTSARKTAHSPVALRKTSATFTEVLYRPCRAVYWKIVQDFLPLRKTKSTDFGLNIERLRTWQEAQTSGTFFTSRDTVVEPLVSRQIFLRVPIKMLSCFRQ